MARRVHNVVYRSSPEPESRYFEPAELQQSHQSLFTATERISCLPRIHLGLAEYLDCQNSDKPVTRGSTVRGDSVGVIDTVRGI